MRHGDLKVLFVIALLTGGIYFGAESGFFTHAVSNAASTASGALAYWDDEESDPYNPYAQDQRYGGPYYEPDDSGYSGRYPIESEPTDEYWNGPYYWSDNVTIESDPYYETYYDPYYVDSIVIDDTPWYVDAFPGIGQTFSYLLPPIVTSRPIVQPPTPLRPTCSIVASPSSVASGGSTVVSWSTQNSARAVLSGVGDVPGTGSRTFSNLTASQTFALSVSGLGGSNTCATSVYVQQGEITPSCQISTNPEVIRRGEAANLAWVSQNAVSARLSGEGGVAQSGGRIVAPSQTTVYSLQVTSRSGKTASCAATLTVQ